MCKHQEQGCNAHIHTHMPVPGLRQKTLDPAVKSGWELGSGLCHGEWWWHGSTRRSPESCLVPRNSALTDPVIHWTDSPWLVGVEVKLFTCVTVSHSAAAWAGEVSQAMAFHVAGEAPAVCQPSNASPQRSCLSSFPHLGCFAIYSPGNVSASQRVAKHFLPLVINLFAGLQGVVENRAGSRGCALSFAHPATAGDKELNLFSVQTSVSRSPTPKASITPSQSWTPWGDSMQS